MGESQKAMAPIGLFPFRLGCRGTPCFCPGLQALNVLAVLAANLAVLFASSRHSFLRINVL